MRPNEPIQPESLTVLLIRHAEPVAHAIPGTEENQRPLSKKGARDAQMLAASLVDVQLSGIFSSPYQRAFQTAALIAADRGLRVEVIDDLRERLLSPRLLPDWREHLQRSWSDFDYVLPDGESSRTAPLRVITVLDHL